MTAPQTTPDARPSAQQAALLEVPHNVPLALSSLVGRVREREAVLDALARARLVTITGPGGTGKTRLAREVALALAARAPGSGAPDVRDGVWWVELAPVARGESVAGAIASILGVRIDGGRSAVDAIATAIGDRRLLVVLDNCEHVIDDAAAAAERLLRACPRIALLATSREALSIEGEAAWAAAPLAHPPAPRTGGPGAAPLTAADASQYDAVRLFAERARAAQPDFAVTDANVGAVASICARLDGVPLAIELAAPHVATLGVDQLALRIDDALGLLDRGRRSGPARHRTLRALLDWSYALLAPAEQRMLCRMSVLHAPVPLDGVCAVCGDPEASAGAAVASLGRLVEQSFVDVRDADGEVRYRVLETVRQYGAARLAGTDDEAATRARHARWLGDVADVLGEETGSAMRGRAMTRFHPLIDDARAALAWSTGPHGDPVDALRIAGGLAIFWHWAGVWAEGRTWADVAIRASDAAHAARASSTGVDGGDLARPLVERFALARALQTALMLAWMINDSRAAIVSESRALPLWASIEQDPAADASLRRRTAQWSAYTHELVAFAYHAIGDTVSAVRSVDAAVDAAHRCGSRWAIGLAHGWRAMLAPAIGRAQDVAPDLAIAERELRAIGDTWVLSWCYAHAAAAALAQGRAVEAAGHARRAVETLRPEPDWHYVSRGLDLLAAAGALWLDGAAAGDARLRVAGEVATVLGAAAGVRERSGTAVWPFDVDAHATTVDRVRDALGDDAYDAAWQAGRVLPSEHAFALAEVAVALHDARDAAVPDESGAVDDGRDAPGVLRVLAAGPLLVEHDGAPLGDRVPGGKATELLLFLLCHPEGRTREQIGLALWPDASAAQVRNQFHVVVHALRRALGDARWVAHDDGAYRVPRVLEASGAQPAAALDFDVDAVLEARDRLRRAIRRAEPLDDATLAAARRTFERVRGELGEGLPAGDWIVPFQDRLRTAWEDGMTAVAQALASTGRPAEAGEVYVAILARDPLRESAHRALMTCLAQAGEPARAVAHYDALVRLLAREVGAAPARETRALVDRIRAGG